MRWSAGRFASNCFLCYFFFLHLTGRCVVAMGIFRAALVALMVSPTLAVTTTLANCQSACNLGKMLCLNKNASSTLCSAVQRACMAGCYASRVDCGCADASVTHCEEIKLRPTRMTNGRNLGRIFHTGHSLRERVRPQAPISRSSRLAGREFVRANGGRARKAMPPHTPIRARLAAPGADGPIDGVMRVAHNDLADLFMIQGDLDVAEEVVRRAIVINPEPGSEEAVAFFTLSKILEKKNDIPGAIDAIKEYIRRGDPDNDGEQQLATLREKLSLLLE